MKKRLLFLAAAVTIGIGAMAQGNNLGTIKQTPQSPTIDGLANEGLWEQVDVIPLSNTAFVKGVNPATAMGKVRVLYDADSIYMLVEIDDDKWNKDGAYGNTSGHDDGIECPIGFGRVDEKDHTVGTADFGRMDLGADYADTLAHYETATPSITQGDRTEGNSFFGNIAEGGLNAKMVLGQSAIGEKVTFEVAVAISALPVQPETLIGSDMLLDVRYNDDDANADNEDPNWPGTTKRESQINLGSDFEKAQDGSWWWEAPYNCSRVTLGSESINPGVSVFQNAATPTFNVYPNPAADAITVSNVEAGSIVNVYSVVGQEVLSAIANSSNVQININELNTGVYFVKVGDATQKLVVK